MQVRDHIFFVNECEDVWEILKEREGSWISSLVRRPDRMYSDGHKYSNSCARVSFVKKFLHCERFCSRSSSGFGSGVEFSFLA